MPSLNSRSPSLKKMDYNNNTSSPRRGGRKRFDFGNIIGDAFSLATTTIAIAGWLIAFVSSIVAAINAPYPNYSWWTLAYMFCLIIGVIITVGMDAVQTYHVALVGFVSAGLVFTTSSVNAFIYSSQPAKEAAAAGLILVSMVNIVWIFYFGSQPNAAHRQTIDSFALHKDHAPSRNSRHMTQSFARPETTHSASHPPQMYNSAQLAGFETSSPVMGYPGAAPGASNSTTAFPQPVVQQQQNGFPMPQHTNNSQPGLAPAPVNNAPSAAESVAQPSEYPYRAKAIYSYEANPDDANEISFSKHEILEVSDVSGRWWQAKKENGDTGIAPSNYLILL
nr:high osmolarity signaling protein sho1b [Quercus suber]